MDAPPPGTIGWIDLTVPNADQVRDFYSAVAGWTAQPVNMGEYVDYAMSPPGSQNPIAGVCFARGVNHGLPPCWLVYITVPNLAAAMAQVERRGGRIIRPPVPGAGYFAVIQDPGGAFCALHQAPATPLAPGKSSSKSRKSVTFRQVARKKSKPSPPTRTTKKARASKARRR